MKKIILTALIGTTSFALANAGGWCRVGSANLSDNGNGSATLHCPGNGTCYETDESGIVAPGHHILIHMGEARIDAVVMSATGSTNPPNTPPGPKPIDELPTDFVVSTQ